MTIEDLMLPVSKVDPRNQLDFEFDYIYIGGVDGNRGEILETQRLTGSQAPSRARQLVRAGDTVLSTVRTYMRKTALVPSHLDGQVASTGFSVLRPAAGVEPMFLYHAVRRQQFVDTLSSLQTGSSYPAVRDKDVRSMPVPLAPTAEQERIVAAIEEHLSRLDAAEAAASSAERRIKTLENAIITQASSTLDPPAHWRLVTVAEAGTVGLGLQRSPRRHSGSNMRPYLRVANVFEDRIDDSDVMSMDMTDAEWERFRLRNGDVLLNEGQSPELLGRPAIYRDDPPEVAFTNSLIRFQANDDVDPEWALLVFRSHMHSRRFMRESQITTNIAHLAAGRFKTVEFPLPPRDEQRVRVTAARTGLEACARLRREIVVCRTRSAGLRRAILAAAFAGQLVPQDPADEPASALLGRIRAERSAATPTKRTRKAKAS